MPWTRTALLSCGFVRTRSRWTVGMNLLFAWRSDACAYLAVPCENLHVQSAKYSNTDISATNIKKSTHKFCDKFLRYGGIAMQP
jgi:hypothetical protein